MNSSKGSGNLLRGKGLTFLFSIEAIQTRKKEGLKYITDQ
jgi:hypothetical protein